MTIELTHLLQFKKDRIIARYRKEYPKSKMLPEESWIELMKFIWLYHQHEADKKQRPEDKTLQFACVIHEEMKDIDNMWHTFLLFTKEYQLFCLEYLDGIFFHHDPLEEEAEVNHEEYAEELALYLSYIYDKLGENTVLKWFDATA